MPDVMRRDGATSRFPISSHKRTSQFGCRFVCRNGNARKFSGDVTHSSHSTQGDVQIRNRRIHPLTQPLLERPVPMAQ